MKILVEIPKEYYDLLHEYEFKFCTMDMALLRNGIPVDIEFLKKNEYRRGYHDALKKALNGSCEIHCEEGDIRVVKEETLKELGMSMDCPLGG